LLTEATKREQGLDGMHRALVNNATIAGALGIPSRRCSSQASLGGYDDESAWEAGGMLLRGPGLQTTQKPAAAGGQQGSETQTQAQTLLSGRMGRSGFPSGTIWLSFLLLFRHAHLSSLEGNRAGWGQQAEEGGRSQPAGGS
jgi:hypothetical protein